MSFFGAVLDVFELEMGDEEKEMWKKMKLWNMCVVRVEVDTDQHILEEHGESTEQSLIVDPTSPSRS